MTVSVRRLTAADAAAYRDIRLEALADAPTAFSSDVAREAGDSLDDWAARLGRNLNFGATEASDLLGIATLLTEASAKTRHRGHVVAVYVRPEARGWRIGRTLIEALITAAPDYVEQLHLSVTAGNDAARHLYERLGFSVYATEPRGIRVDGRYYDQHLMVLRLQEGSRKVTDNE